VTTDGYLTVILVSLSDKKDSFMYTLPCMLSELKSRCFLSLLLSLLIHGGANLYPSSLTPIVWQLGDFA